MIARRDQVADVVEVVLGCALVVEVELEIRVERCAPEWRSQHAKPLRDEVLIRMHGPERDPEIEPLSPVRAQPGVDATRRQLAQPRDERRHLRVAGDGGLGLAHPRRVQGSEVPAILERRNEGQRDDPRRERGTRPRGRGPQDREDPSAAVPDEHDRGDVHAADEAVEEQRLLQRKDRGERTERRATEVEDEPDEEERDREQRVGHARDDGVAKAEAEQHREQGKTAVIGELAGEEPAKDRRRSIRGVLLRLQVGARVEEAALEDVRKPHP